jgi:peptidoglycan/LPS O-acetylase OafA/YrhL
MERKMNAQSSITQRRYDLDWLRVFAILTVFIYHSTRFFNLGNWHVKSPLMYFGVDVFEKFLETWMMPLIFLISGAAIFFAMRKGGAGKFFKDKFLRLGVPYLVVVFTHASLQVYLERISHHQFEGSYFQFLPHYFEGIYIDAGVGGNFAIFGMHLWYLLFLMIFCILCYPLFRWLKGRGQRVLDGFGNFLAVPGVAYLLFLPTALFLDFIEGTAIGESTPGGWPLPVYLCFFIMGFVFVSNQRLQKRVLQMRWISLVGGVLVLAAYLILMVTPSTMALYDDLNGPLACVISWFALFAILGFGMKHLNFSTPFLSYANEAVLPFYIFHQTVLLSVGYFVVQWAIPAGLMWLIILTASFAIIMLLYEFLVRRHNTLRFLFGMKPLPAQPVPEVGKALPVQ